MRFFLFLGFLLLIDWYAFQAFRTITVQWSAGLRQVITLLFWSVPLILVIYMLALQNGYNESWGKIPNTVIRTFLFIAYFSKFLILPFLVIDDFRRGFQYLMAQFNPRSSFDPARSRFLSQFGLALGSIPFFSLTYGMIRNPYRYQVIRQRIALPNLPEKLEGLRIVQISDIHSGSFLFKEPIRNAIQMINAHTPDLVFFTGDLVNNEAKEMDGFMDVFNGIQARYGVFSILGNHDYGDYVRWDSPEAKVANLERLKAIHGELGWQILINENRLLDIQGEQVAVIGVENYSAHLRFPKYGDLAKAHSGTDQAGLKLLLSHDPSHWENQVTTQYSDIDITFSGHTHGFQFGVEIPGWFKWSPIQYVYKQWAGLYQAGNQYLYVNRGFGHLGYPGRVGILPEITVLELTRQAVS